MPYIRQYCQMAFVYLTLFLVITLVLSLLNPSKAATNSHLNLEQAQWLGERIYQNECNQDPQCLTSWNIGEDFPSLGIGHFIWYQAEQEGIFEETFPELMNYLQVQGVEIPAWIIEQEFNSPWTDRESFLADFHQERLVELRHFLLENSALQAKFIIERFEHSLDIIIENSLERQRAMLKERFYLVANDSKPYGLYALIDYTHFKGEGISQSEQYKQQGWGLLQVLDNMESSTTMSNPVKAFVNSAKQILSLRVENAPESRHEERWLKGWHNRLETYLPPQD